MQINEILAYFKNVKRLSGTSYQVCCPCHNDSKASLTITQRGDKLLMHCHAGCRTEDIVSAIGLKMADLCGEQRQAVKTWRERMGNVEAVYDYGAYIKLRQAGKKIRYGRVVGDEFISGMPEAVEKTLYRLSDFQRAVKNGETVYYAEGEKDVDNLRLLGLTATTAGGCGDWRGDFARYFTGARLVILPDNDESGQALAQRILADVRELCYSVKLVTVSNIPKGDVSDYLKMGGTRESLLRLIEVQEERYASWVKLSDKKPVGIYTDRLAHTIETGLDYAIINTAGLDIAQFHIYRDGVYRKCSKNEAKGYIKQYLPLGTATDSILNNIYNLILCSTDKTYSFDTVNTDEGVINVRNGLIDLRAKRLIKHSPDIISTLQLNCSYIEGAECPNWIRYVSTLCSDMDGNTDSEKLAVLQEWTGLLLSNVTVSRTKKCLVLTSPLGNTGKSVYLYVLGHILGIENTINIPIQKMSDRFAMSDLCGKRADLVGDQTSEDIEDSSGFKQLTGGDGVKIEFKGKQSFNWEFTGGVVVCCNDLPTFTDDKGGHIFERLTILPCERVIPKESRDGNLSHKLLKEADGILNWALEGLYRLKANRFKFSPCTASDKVLAGYRSRLDTLYAFIDENYTVTECSKDRIKKTEFENNYIKWCEANGVTALKKSNIALRAAKNGIEMTRVNGICCYKGIAEKMFTETEEDLLDEFEV